MHTEENIAKHPTPNLLKIYVTERAQSARECDKKLADVTLLKAPQRGLGT